MKNSGKNTERAKTSWDKTIMINPNTTFCRK